MKRSAFSNKPRKPLKRTPLARISPNKVKKSKTSIYKWIPPKWLGSIPQGSHGSTSIQKKTWKVISDYVRIKDYYTYGGQCVSCEHYFQSWKDSQCGHFKSWGASNSYGKLFMLNLAAQCPHCNHIDDGAIGFNFGAELMNRYGLDVIEKIEEENNNRRGQKMEDIILIGMIETLLPSFKSYPEKPDWYDKVLAKKNEL